MSETVKLITENGILVVVAGVFLLLAYRGFGAWLAQIKCLKDSHEKAVVGFLQCANAFNATVTNHMVHEEVVHQEMMKALEQLCLYMDKEHQQTRRLIRNGEREGTD